MDRNLTETCTLRSHFTHVQSKTQEAICLRSRAGGRGVQAGEMTECVWLCQVCTEGVSEYRGGGALRCC